MRTNAKHRLFAKYLAEGMSQTEAYVKAGFIDKNPSSGAAKLLKRNSSILQWRDEILEKQAALQQQAVEEVLAEKKRDLGQLLDDLYQIKDMGMAAVPVLDPKGNPIGEYRADLSNAIKAIVAIGQQCFGAFVEKKEVRKAPLEDLTDKELVERAQQAADRMGIKLPKITLQ